MFMNKKRWIGFILILAGVLIFLVNGSLTGAVIGIKTFGTYRILGIGLFIAGILILLDYQRVSGYNSAKPPEDYDPANVRPLSPKELWKMTVGVLNANHLSLADGRRLEDINPEQLKFEKKFKTGAFSSKRPVGHH